LHSAPAAPPLPSVAFSTILNERAVRTVFQPICSIRSRGIVGIEALARCDHPETGEPVNPALLFETARALGRGVELDRLCRQTALEAFLPLHRAHPELSVFINFDVSVLDEGAAGSGVFTAMAERLGINPGNIIIEIVESQVHEIADLHDFARRHRERGYLFALDDVGAGHSNLERLSIVKPDVLKLDRGLIQDIENECYKQEVVSALIHLGHRIGALVVGEGVETAPQALRVLELGADLLQGYYLARPAPPESALDDTVLETVYLLAAEFRQHLVHGVRARHARSREHTRIARTLSAALASVDPDQFDEALRDQLGAFPSVECMYVLNDSGVQESETVFAPAKAPSMKKFIFHPARRGDDHSMKEYVMLLRAGLPMYVTEPYVSLASGRLCRTLSVGFYHPRGHSHILCIDLDENE
jgi:EAL domain-containing protein (putative c-di-GMP-specific phosphodiesterase class I)